MLHHLRRSSDRYFGGLSVGGMVMALLFFCFSMTPSLLPRPWYLQGVASGICTVLGYALGTTIAWLLRKFGFRPLHRPHQRRIINRVLKVAAAVLIPLFGLLGAIWQHQVRRIVHADLDDPNFYPLVLLMAFALARLVLGTVRIIRRTTRRIGRFGSRWIPLPVAKLIAAVLVVGLLGTVVADALLPSITSAMNASFSLTDSGTADDVTRPTATERSGSPTSLVDWDDLGFEGRSFVAQGPSRAEIARFTARVAPSVAASEIREPIRAYAGLDSAETLQDEADLVVAELERTGAFDRSVLAVATTTGRGWVNEVAVEALEYLWHGDVATASMQYSYLPSPVAFLADRHTPPDAGEILFETVRRAWLTRSPAHRPKLIVLGESLGSYGSQGAFGSLNDVLSETDGAVWVGTPSFTPLWSTLVQERRAGSPEQIPDYDGCHRVCFVASPSDFPAGAHPTVVYVQHVNDPIVWWSPDLLLRRPGWLAEPALPARSSSMTWIPLVTFWQVTADMVLSTKMPPGYGHEYDLILANAFAAVVPPPGWTDADTAMLRERLTGVPTGG